MILNGIEFSSITIHHKAKATTMNCYESDKTLCSFFSNLFKINVMKYVSLFCLFIFIVSCQQPAQEESITSTPEPDYTSHHLPAIKAVFDAHGGYDSWTDLKMLSYENGGSKTLVELQNRYTRIDSENQTVGFDGENVWVYPASDNADSQRMRYNLMFYFYAFPFVVGDPGVNYEMVDPIEIKGETYDAIEISYDSGVGDAPNDVYVVLADQQTHQMEWLLYTATFGGEPSDRFSLIKYEGWKEMEGVILPSSLQWYQYSEGKAGDPIGGPRVFENIQVSKEYPAMSNFEMPEGASVAELPKGN